MMNNAAARLIDGFPFLIFDPSEEKRNQQAVWIYLLILYLAGILLWGVVFDFRRSPLNFHDWRMLFLPRFDAIRDAINYRMLPLHVSCGECLLGVTDRFFVIPDVVVTPQMILLSFLDVDTFALFDLLLHYTTATVGLILLRQKLNLSLMSYSFLFFLFNFNGFVQANYAVGHLNWGGYFLFPFYFLLLFQIFDRQPSWKWVAQMAFLSLYMILAGSQHHYTWMMLFLLFLAFSYLSSFKWMAAAMLFSGFLSAVRLLPPVLGLNDFSDPFFRFRTGYHTLYDLWSSLVMIRPPDFDQPVIYRDTNLGYWEFDYFISFIGACFIIYFGFINMKNGGTFRKYLPLLIPALALFILSQGQIYKYTFFNLPILSSERIATRMISLPMTFFMIMAAFQFQEFLDRYRSGAIRWFVTGALLMLVHELYTHAVIWNVDALGDFFGKEKMQFDGNSIINYSDPVYITTLTIGLILTLLTAIVLWILVRRENHIKKFDQTK
jgi:hypothetical protein